MLNFKKNISLEHSVNFLLYLFPISLMIGSSIVHINLYLFIISCIFYIKAKNYKLNFSYSNRILICFFLSIIISSFVNHFKNEWINPIDTPFEMLTHGYFFNSILLFRFLILYLVLEILIVKNKINIKKFFISCFLCVALVSFDVIIQYLFGYNLLGYKIIEAGITSVFADEAIAGSFIQKLSLFGIFGALFFFNNKNKKILFFIIILFLIGTLLASNRINVFLFIFSLIILFILNKKIRLTLLLSFITFICISQFLFKNDENLKFQYQHLYLNFYEDDSVVENRTKEVKENIKSLKNINPYSSDHLRIYHTTIESWKYKPILGLGHKSFRVNCRNIISENAKVKKYSFDPICSSHPHNYQLEILHNTGLIGFILILFFVFILLLKIFKKLLDKKLNNQNYFMYFIPIVISAFIEIWPLRSAGSLFATWNGTTVWILLGLSSMVNSDFIKKNVDKPIKNQNSFILKLVIILFSSLIIKRFFF